MDSIASQITSLTIVYSTVHSDADQSKHQSSASLAFVWEIHRWPVNFPHKWPVTRKMFPFDDVIMFKETGLDVIHYKMFESYKYENTATSPRGQQGKLCCESWPQIALYHPRIMSRVQKKECFQTVKLSVLTHWGQVMHKLAIIGSDNGLSPGQCQAIIWSSAGILYIGPLGTNFSGNLIGIQATSFKKMHSKMSSAKWCHFRLGLNVLNS